MTINLKTKLLCINFNVCFGCSEETSHRGDSFELPQHVFWLINKKNPHFFYYALLSWGLGLATRNTVFDVSDLVRLKPATLPRGYKT